MFSARRPSSLLPPTSANNEIGRTSTKLTPTPLYPNSNAIAFDINNPKASPQKSLHTDTEGLRANYFTLHGDRCRHRLPPTTRIATASRHLHLAPGSNSNANAFIMINTKTLLHQSRQTDIERPRNNCFPLYGN